MFKSISSEKYLALIGWLKDARNEQNLSMRDLASLIDEPHQFIGKVESAERRLDVYEYYQYCKALNLNPAEGLDRLK
ncbi:helix-turn-helix domain-containing protein [Alkalimarinus alittae]|uniref:Helix-turn-helix transcriptional regulator n=1 Tax=Alkalimarinus alittae TaxID=2961619 RepID=A0ABY6N6J8_9ALTE|nr:helix-turn-helix transcriptional regulator [Alkalimarinus alittae]UZE97622.1 helix-turn-helix transcriptional regulator [Alkalimarinus alittae]